MAIKTGWGKIVSGIKKAWGQINSICGRFDLLHFKELLPLVFNGIKLVFAFENGTSEGR